MKKICENCKHWNIVDMVECSKINTSPYEDKKDLINIPRRNCAAHVGKNFGCIHFKNKELLDEDH